MVLSSPMSTVLAGYKCGSKGLFNLEKELSGNTHITTNDVYGLDILNCFSTKSISSIKRKLTSYTAENLLKFIEGENISPFFIIIRNPDTLYRAQIIQSVRELCRNNNALEESIVVANTQNGEKQQLFELLRKLFPHLVKDIFNDQHYKAQSYHELLILIQYLQINKPDIFKNLFILDLDNYSRTIDSINLLSKFNVIGSTSESHSTKALFFPNSFSIETIPGIYAVPYKLNTSSYNLIYSNYEDKIYTYARLLEYDC